MTTTAEIWLPFPPSVNNLFCHSKQGRRFKSRSYKSWSREAAQLIMIARLPQITGKVRVILVHTPPDARRRDIDNLQKAVLDAVVMAGVIEDDSLVMKLTASWGTGTPGTLLTITSVQP